jgi:hypothetical protein
MLYNNYPAGGVLPGYKVRPLATVGPSVPKPEDDDYPLTVANVQWLTPDRVRIWAHKHGARVSVESPIHYGTFDKLATVEAAP